MKTSHLLVPFFLLACLTAAASAADTSVTLSDVHLCCTKCVAGVNTAVAPVTGAKAVCNMQAKTVAITAPDKDTAQKAVNALVAAGYFGKSSDETIKVDAATGAPEGKVATLEVSGVHLCCNSCITAVNAVLARVPGAASKNVTANAKSFTVTGDFSAKALFDELQKAGLTGKAAPK